MSTGNPGGDSLARGAKSASWGAIRVSDEKWDAIFGPREVKKPAKKTKRVPKLAK